MMVVVDDRFDEPAALPAVVEAVWSATTAENVRGALAESNRWYPMAAVRFFRGAIRWRWSARCDPRVVTWALYDWVGQFPEAAWPNFAPRETEALIRAELNGEFDLVAEVPIDHLPVRNCLQLVTRMVFEEAVGDAAEYARLRSITAKAASEHRGLAAATEMKLDQIYAWRSLTLAELDGLVREVEAVKWT
ncbi:hypothetical protein ACFW1A_40550 [Kitasatospora sp. NPDC058965]|uniref:hypothetical protein n=1 Tax=Kitasatospora sp. NPDC058965 TaxID=3346682 RepID=UPI0036D132E4